MSSPRRYWNGRVYTILSRQHEGRTEYQAAIMPEHGRRPLDTCGHQHHGADVAFTCQVRMMREAGVPRKVISGQWWRRGR